MTDELDFQLTGWLREGPARGPSEGLEAALVAAHATAQRPAWRVRRWWLGDASLTWLPSRRLVLVAITAALVVGLLAVALAGNRPTPLDRIVFVRGDAVFVSDMGDSEVPIVAAPPAGYSFADLRWSPDHAHIAFLLSAEGGDRLLILDDRGATVGTYGGQIAMGFAWAPDSRRIAVYQDGSLDRIAIDRKSVV